MTKHINKYYYNLYTRKMVLRLIHKIKHPLNKNHIQEFLIDTFYHKKNSTYKTYYALTSSLLSKLYKDKIIDFKIQDLILPKIENKDQVVPSLNKRIELQDIQALSSLLKAQGFLKYYYFIEILSQSGLRCQELKDIDFFKDFVRNDQYHQVLYIKGKGGKKREIFIPLNLTEEIKKLYKSPQPFKSLKFPTMFLKRFCKAHNLKEITPHQLRSFYGTYLLESKQVDIHTLARLLGHSSIDTTARYYLRTRIDSSKLLIK